MFTCENYYTAQICYIFEAVLVLQNDRCAISSARYQYGFDAVSNSPYSLFIRLDECARYICKLGLYQLLIFLIFRCIHCSIQPDYTYLHDFSILNEVLIWYFHQRHLRYFRHHIFLVRQLDFSSFRLGYIGHLKGEEWKEIDLFFSRVECPF